MKILLVLLAGLMLTGCAATPSGKADPRDPLERFNRASFKFNDALDHAIARPVAKAYVKVTPTFIRTGVSNAFSNLDNLTTIVNDTLQGKFGQAGRDSARFLLNTTLGLGGLFDPAPPAGLESHDEDFGQTLGKWGVRSGAYLMIPLLGPSTVRDGLGRLADQFSYPPNYLKDADARYAIRAVEFIDLRASLLSLDEQLDRSYDRYAFVRNAWLQNREYKVTDGNVADPSLELEDEIKDEPAGDTQPAAPSAPPAH